MKKSVINLTMVVVLLSLYTPNGFAQSAPFNTDSIPLVDNQVQFSYHIQGEMSKEDFFKQAHFVLDRELDSYSGSYIENSEDLIVCRIIDYLELESSFFSIFGMYMTYDVTLVPLEDGCDVTIGNIHFVEKSNYEMQQETPKKLDVKEYPAKVIMVDKHYSQLFIRKTSDKITQAAIDRYNFVVNKLEASLTRE